MLLCWDVQAEEWGNLPLFALGASSGSAMVALLPFFLELRVRTDTQVLMWPFSPTSERLAWSVLAGIHLAAGCQG